MLKRPHHITDYQITRSYMPRPLMGPVALWENVDGGMLLCGVLCDKLLKLLKEKVNQVTFAEVNDIQLALCFADEEQKIALGNEQGVRMALGHIISQVLRLRSGSVSDPELCGSDRI